MTHHYKLSQYLFAKVKPYLDGRIFFRNVDNNSIEIKTSSTYIKSIMDNLAEKFGEGTVEHWTEE